MSEIDAVSRNILRALSENSRMSYNEIAKRAGCSPQTAKKRVKWLEKEFGIKYVLEFDEEKLGLSAAYVTYAKFKSPPPTELLKKLLQMHDGPQFAALTKGDFDLIVYFSGRSNLDFSKWANWFRQQLDDCLADWQPAHIVGFWYGFFPLSPGTVARIPLEGSKKKMLMLLSQDARMPLGELAKKCGIPPSTAHYYLRKILGADYLRRCTILMERPPYPINSISFHSYHIGKQFMASNLKARHSLIRDEPPFSASNQLIMAFNAPGSFDDFWIRSFETLEECNAYTGAYVRIFTKVAVFSKMGIVMSVIHGALPVRNLDARKEYNQKLGIYDMMETD